MHELSIAQNLIEAACETADSEGASRVTRLNVRIGQLAGVVKDAFLFSFDVASENTLCAGAHLSVEEVPVTVHCPQCAETKTIADLYCFTCPNCGSPTPQIVTGQELEFISIEFETNAEPEDIINDAACA